jgi:hypothetical protein
MSSRPQFTAASRSPPASTASAAPAFTRTERASLRAHYHAGTDLLEPPEQATRRNAASQGMLANSGWCNEPVAGDCAPLSHNDRNSRN